jgi:hypothetical protein
MDRLGIAYNEGMGIEKFYDFVLSTLAVLVGILFDLASLTMRSSYNTVMRAI